MTKEELSLLLYLETCAVDNGGKVVAVRLNKDDFAIAKTWTNSGFVNFTRLPSKIMMANAGKTTNAQFSHRVILSNDAWKEAHAERRARAKRTAVEVERQIIEANEDA